MTPVQFMDTVGLPRTHYDECVRRNVPVPPPVCETHEQVWVKITDDNVMSLFDDAKKTVIAGLTAPRRCSDLHHAARATLAKLGGALKPDNGRLH
ncbi:MAG: hypothetical protein AAGE03_04565 [Pseudomonadota bacterium]